MTTITDSTNECSQKCECSIFDNISYFKPGTSSDYLTLIPSDVSSKVLSFQGINYSCSSIDVYVGAKNKYTNPVDGELVVVCKTEGGELLYVCIPISTSGKNTGASILEDIVEDYSKKQLIDFSLLDLISLNTECYTYTAIGDAVVIAFDSGYAIFIEENTTLDSLKKFTKTPSYSLAKISALSEITLNNKGITNGGTTDDIYIDCSPTDNDSNASPILVEKKRSKFSLDGILGSSKDIGIYLVYAFFFIAVLFAVNYLFKLIK